MFNPKRPQEDRPITYAMRHRDAQMKNALGGALLTYSASGRKRYVDHSYCN